jgi:hypothetical protein
VRATGSSAAPNAAGEAAHQGLVDRRALEPEVVDVLGQRQLGDRHLGLDRARLLLGDLGRDEVADHPLRLVLALHRRGEDLGTLHHALLLRLS